MTISRWVILLRHAESEKNTARMFSQLGARSSLTSQGERQAAQFGAALRGVEFASAPSLCIRFGNSARAKETASLIGQVLDSSDAALVNLPSIDLGSASHKSELQVERELPKFALELEIYRSGLLNSYLMHNPEGSEDKLTFERRTWNEFDSSVKKATKRNVLFVLHRSPITSIMNGIARQNGFIASDYYGHVNIGYCRGFLLKATAGGYQILGADVDAKSLIDRISFNAGSSSLKI